MTSFPFSARHAPATSPTYPVPTTAIFILYSEGLRPSDSPTRALASRFAGSLRSRGSLRCARSLLPSRRFAHAVGRLLLCLCAQRLFHHSLRCARSLLPSRRFASRRRPFTFAPLPSAPLSSLASLRSLASSFAALCLTPSAVYFCASAVSASFITRFAALARFFLR